MKQSFGMEYFSPNDSTLEKTYPIENRILLSNGYRQC